MPAVLLDPPAPGTYKRVLVRKDYDWDLCYGFHYYDEDADSRGIMFRGIRYMTIFLKGEHAIDYALKTGWIDMTEQWFNDHPEAAVSPVEPVEPSEPVAPVEPPKPQSAEPVPSPKGKGKK